MAQPQPSQQLARAWFVQAPGAAAPGSGDSKPTALRVNGALRFALVHSTSRAPAAPFASLTAGRQLGTAALNPLFSLASLSGSGSSSAYGSSSDSGSGDAAGGSGYETGTDSGDSSDLQLDKINCQICRQPLSKRAGGKRFWQRRKQQKKEPNMFLICDCCQRCFHEDCCREKSISTRQQKNGSWFHSSDCQECHKHLKQQAAAGPVALPGDRTWQLIDCEPRSSKDVGGVRALQQLKADLGGVLEVLLPSYGPGAAQQLVDTNNGYALLLRQGQLPVTAGLLDVYGTDLAVLDLVATAMEEQGIGHCSALVGALEGWLGPRLGVAQLLAVCPNDEPETVQLWQRRYGFRRLGNKQLSHLQTSVPPLNYYQDSVLLAKNLPKQQQQSVGKQQQAVDAAAGKKAAAAANKRRAATSAVVTEAVVAAAATGAAVAAGTSEQEGA